MKHHAKLCSLNQKPKTKKRLELIRKYINYLLKNVPSFTTKNP